MKRFGLGFALFISLILVGFGTLLVGDLHDIFGRKTFLKIHFERVQGLRVGDDVRVDGYLDGKVKDIELLPTEKHGGTGVLVTVRLKDPIVVFEDSEITVESSSVLGGSQVSIRRGSKGKGSEINEKTLLPGKTQPGLEQVGKLVDDNKDNIHAVIANLKELTQAIKDGQGTVGKLIKSDELHKEAVETIKTAKETIADTKGEIKKLGDNLNKLVDKVDKGEGPLAHLLNDKKMADDLQKTIQNFEKVGENFKKVSEKLDSGEGTIGKLIGDKEMGNKVKKIVDDLGSSAESIKTVTHKLQAGEGSIGKLLQDDELYEKAKQTMDDIDKVFAKAARSIVEIVVDGAYLSKSEESLTKLGLRISPSDDKFIYVGASAMSLKKDGDILFSRQQEKNEDDTIFKADVMLGYRIPWFLDHRVTVRGGLLEGKPGAGIDVVWDQWGFCTHPVQFTFEGRDAYNSVSRENIDEEIAGPLLRAYIKTPLWTRRDNWFELLLSTVRLYVGANRIATGKEELLAAVGIEWPDDDLRMLVGFIGLAR